MTDCDIQSLAAWGFPAPCIDAWRARGIRRLAAVQQAALFRHGLLQDRDLLVVAPTASGKTFIAELAALRHLQANRRVAYLAPTRALAEEKYLLFRQTYQPMGYRVAIATREHRDADRPVLEGRFDILVAVYEKMKAYLIARPEMLADVGLVVADEVQAVAEFGRGDAIDLLLTKIAQAPYPCQLLALSAVVGRDASRLAEWLGCQVVAEGLRPVELREGAYDIATHTFHYRLCNGGQPGQETIGPPPEVDRYFEPGEEEMADFGRRAVFDLVERLACDMGEQVLVFVPTRYVSRNWAHLLAARLGLPPCAELADELADFEDSRARKWLGDMARHAVAFHNADLPWDLRELIERHFHSGAIRVLVSTSTLGQGVNLAARNVIHVPVMISTDPSTGNQAPKALSRGRFRNQGGRGARTAQSAAFGRSILVARNRQEADRLIAYYVEDDLEPLQGCLRLDNLQPHVLDLVASRVARDEATIRAMLTQTFSARMRWIAGDTQPDRAIQRAIDDLVESHFLERPDPGKPLLAATGLGEVAATTGLACQTVERIVQYLSSQPTDPSSDPLEALIVFAATTDGRDFHAGPLPHKGAGAQELVATVRARLLESRPPPTTPGSSDRPPLPTHHSPKGGFSRQALYDLRKACILDEWIGPGETREIEERHGIFSGAAANLAAHFAWIAQGASALARAMALGPEIEKQLAALADRLVIGATAQAAPLARLRVRGLSRGYIQALVREGYTTPQAIATADLEDLERLMPRAVAHALKTSRKPERPEIPSAQEAEICRLSAENKPPDPPGEATAADNCPLTTAGSSNPILEVDLRGPGAARYLGRQLSLSPLPFRLLATLAASPGVGIAYQDLERAMWHDTVVERQQVHAHRRALVAALAEIDPDQARGLIEIRPGRGVVLRLTPTQVRLVR